MSGLQVDSNAEAFARSLIAAGQQLADLEPVNQRAGALIAAAPAPHGPTGALAASVRADITANGATIAGHTRYWTFVHWGAPRRHQVAQPWLLEATEAHEQDITELYRDHAATVVADI